ncbi:unnamed protein product, partial [Amoebophrya sp. A120]|eukprot:GSA120T00017137001.1
MGIVPVEFSKIERRVAIFFALCSDGLGRRTLPPYLCAKGWRCGRAAISPGFGCFMLRPPTPTPGTAGQRAGLLA